MKFVEFQKECQFRGWDGEKCVHSSNEKYRLVGSCCYRFCPIKGELQPNLGKENVKPKENIRIKGSVQVEKGGEEKSEVQNDKGISDNRERC